MPQHAHSVSLVLSLQTGLVSPQFHCSFDDLFETTKPGQIHILPTSLWQQKTNFEEIKETREQIQQEVKEIVQIVEKSEEVTNSVPPETSRLSSESQDPT